MQKDGGGEVGMSVKVACDGWGGYIYSKQERLRGAYETKVDNRCREKEEGKYQRRTKLVDEGRREKRIYRSSERIWA